MTMSGRSVRDHDWCVWIYEAGVLLMVIRLMFSVTNIINCTSGRVHVNLFLDFIRAHPKSDRLAERGKIRVMTE